MTTRDTSQKSTPNNASSAKASEAKGAAMTPPSYGINSVDSGLVIQAMSVTPANDKYEQEANSVAQRVVQQINTPQPVQRKGEEAPNSIQRSIVNLVQRSGGDVMGGTEVSSDVESRIQATRGSGSPIAEEQLTKLESAFGADFSGVRVHTDSRAHTLNQSVQARAFTTGQDIFFRQGEYQPQSGEGQELLAHELTHVVQQDLQSRKKIQRVKTDNTTGTTGRNGFTDGARGTNPSASKKELGYKDKILKPIESPVGKFTLKMASHLSEKDGFHVNLETEVAPGFRVSFNFNKDGKLTNLKYVQDKLRKELESIKPKVDIEKYYANLGMHVMDQARDNYKEFLEK
jgi:hypothetical protein